MKPYILLFQGDASTFAQTEPLNLGDLDKYNISVEFSSGTINGSLKLQAKTSLDATAWIDVLDSVQAVVSGANHMWNVSGAAYQFVRAVWTYGSGAGTITIYALIKENPIIGA